MSDEDTYNNEERWHVCTNIEHITVQWPITTNTQNIPVLQFLSAVLCSVLFFKVLEQIETTPKQLNLMYINKQWVKTSLINTTHILVMILVQKESSWLITEHKEPPLERIWSLHQFV